MDKVPIMDWESDDTFDHDVVWWSRLDNRFQIEVRRLQDVPGRAELVIFDRDKDNKVIHDEEVGLMYGAQFGPDMADIALWQDKSVEAVDEYYQDDK